MLDGQNILPAQLVVGQLGGVLARYGRNLQYRELVAVGGDDRPAVPRSQDPLVAALSGPLRIQDDMLDEGVRLSPNRHQIVLPGAPELLHPQRRFFPDDSLPRACERSFPGPPEYHIFQTLSPGSQAGRCSPGSAGSPPAFLQERHNGRVGSPRAGPPGPPDFLRTGEAGESCAGPGRETPRHSRPGRAGGLLE